MADELSVKISSIWGEKSRVIFNQANYSDLKEFCQTNGCLNMLSKSGNRSVMSFNEEAFLAKIPLNVEVRTTTGYWEYLITMKLPVMKGGDKVKEGDSIWTK